MLSISITFILILKPGKSLDLIDDCPPQIDCLTMTEHDKDFCSIDEALEELRAGRMIAPGSPRPTGPGPTASDLTRWSILFQKSWRSGWIVGQLVRSAAKLNT